MYKKIILVAVTVAVLVGAQNLIAQRPRGDRPMGPPPSEGSQGAWAPWQSPAPIAVNEQEKKILDVLADMYANQRRGTMNVAPEEGRTLRLLAEAIGAKNVVEIGTSNGYSAIWFCLALQATGGKLTTHDIDEGRAAMARENFKKAGVEQIVTLVMGDAHETVKNLKEPIDLLFIDADKEGYVDYLNKLLPLVRPGGLILAHNVHISGGQSPEYVKAITTNPILETHFAHQQGGGLSVSLKKRLAK